MFEQGIFKTLEPCLFGMVINKQSKLQVTVLTLQYGNSKNK
jgi:hypothetical protein